MQMVIIAGGLATRLKELSAKTPKSLIKILNKTFLEYQIDLLKKHDIKDIVLCIGHYGEQIKDYFDSGEKFGVKIKYSDEGESLLGTGGALKKAQDFLQDDFFVMWGDSYLLLDYKEIFAIHKKLNSLALMVVYKNLNYGDKSNVLVQENKVVLYDKWSNRKDLQYIDNGVSVLNKKVLDLIPEDQVFALEFVFKKLSQDGLLNAYKTEQRFYEIGSFSGVEEFTCFAKEHNL